MFVMAAFDGVAQTLCGRLRVLIEALDILTRCEAVKLLWTLVLQLGNMLNDGTQRTGLKWFRLSALRRAMDVRGNHGMTLVEYLAAFLGPVFSSAEWRDLNQAREGETQRRAIAFMHAYDMHTYVHVYPWFLPSNFFAIESLYLQHYYRLFFNSSAGVVSTFIATRDMLQTMMTISGKMHDSLNELPDEAAMTPICGGTADVYDRHTSMFISFMLYAMQ